MTIQSSRSVISICFISSDSPRLSKRTPCVISICFMREDVTKAGKRCLIRQEVKIYE